jgi:hydroxyethylthiazole kinase-like uncharacterized protein yjeF
MEKYSPDKKYLVMSRDEARAFDAWAIKTIGVPGVVLMENAGRSCAELIQEKLKHIENPKVCIFCGTGNNGGDGFVIARHLINAGHKVIVAIFGNQGKIKGDARINLGILRAMNQAIEQINPDAFDAEQQIQRFASDADMVIDGILGTGLTGEVRNGYKKIIETINTLKCPVLAVDIPSGLDCDTGKPLGTAVKADYTVTFASLKKGFTKKEAVQYTGELYIASIGTEPV